MEWARRYSKAAGITCRPPLLCGKNRVYYGLRLPVRWLSMVSAVILAAGASTRMGVQKLLLPLPDEPIVRRTARHICDGGFDEVLVVVGHEWEKVLAALEGLPVRHAVNAEFATGMGSSFRTAV